MKKMTGAIFDVDGVLLDSMPIWDDIGSRYLKKRGIEPEEGLRDILFTMTIKEAAIYLKEHYHLSEEVGELMDQIIGVVREFYEYEAPLKAGVKEYLQSLSEKNIPMVIATSSDRSYLEVAFKRLGISQYFKEICNCNELKTSKKQPYIYEYAARIIGTPIEETYVFEDVLHAAKSAKSAGFTVIGVYDAASESDTEAIKDTVDYYVNRLQDLSEVSVED